MSLGGWALAVEIRSLAVNCCLVCKKCDGKPKNISKYCLLLAGSRFKHGNSSFTILNLRSVGRYSSHRRKPTKFSRHSDRQARARPSGRRPRFLLRAPWSVAYYGGTGVRL